MKQRAFLAFARTLFWLDGKTPLLDVIDEYRQRIFEHALNAYDADGWPQFSMVLTGRAKKNWKSADLILAAFYRFLAWESAQGNDCYILANDEEQAGDDLELGRKIIAANPMLASEVVVRDKWIERKDGKGTLQILPARDVAGMHGKTYIFAGFDEIWGHRNWDVFEALAPDPSRRDALQWVTSYASTYHTDGAPLHDLFKQGKAGTDPSLFFSWYSASYCTDPAMEGLDPLVRANPSMASWDNPGYLEQQRRRLPTHKFRRLHLNEPGMPAGAFLDAAKVADCVVTGRKRLAPVEGVTYRLVNDHSGGSSDDAVAAIGHLSPEGKVVIDCVVAQSGKPPFNPRAAVTKFAAVAREYGIAKVYADAYAGNTFRSDWEAEGFAFELLGKSASDLYDDLEPLINAGEIELLDEPKVTEQALGLVTKGGKTGHLPGEHDDYINAVAGVASILSRRVREVPAVAPVNILKPHRQRAEWRAFRGSNPTNPFRGFRHD